MTTDQIIQLPSAAAERVIQTKKCGRNPKSVLSFREACRERRCVELDKREIAEAIERMKFQLMMTDRMKVGELEHLAILSRPNMSPVERHQLAEKIRYDELPWQEREAIDAAKVRP